MRKRIVLFSSLALAAVALGLGVLGSNSADAAPAFESETYYFEDDDFTEEIGFRIVTCNSGVYTEGEIGNYVARFVGESCNQGTGLYCVTCYQDMPFQRIPCPGPILGNWPECE